MRSGRVAAKTGCLPSMSPAAMTAIGREAEEQSPDKIVAAGECLQWLVGRCLYPVDGQLLSFVSGPARHSQKIATRLTTTRIR